MRLCRNRLHRKDGPGRCAECLRAKWIRTQDRYRGTAKGLAAKTRYNHSDKGRAAQVRYRSGDKRHATLLRYYADHPRSYAEAASMWWRLAREAA